MEQCEKIAELDLEDIGFFLSVMSEIDSKLAEKVIRKCRTEIINKIAEGSLGEIAKFLAVTLKVNRNLRDLIKEIMDEQGERILKSIDKKLSYGSLKEIGAVIISLCYLGDKYLGYCDHFLEEYKRRINFITNENIEGEHEVFYNDFLHLIRVLYNYFGETYTRNFINRVLTKRGLEIQFKAFIRILQGIIYFIDPIFAVEIYSKCKDKTSINECDPFIKVLEIGNGNDIIIRTDELLKSLLSTPADYFAGFLKLLVSPFVRDKLNIDKLFSMINERIKGNLSRNSIKDNIDFLRKLYFLAEYIPEKVYWTLREMISTLKARNLKESDIIYKGILSVLHYIFETHIRKDVLKAYNVGLYIIEFLGDIIIENRKRRILSKDTLSLFKEYMRDLFNRLSELRKSMIFAEINREKRREKLYRDGERSLDRRIREKVLKNIFDEERGYRLGVLNSFSFLHKISVQKRYLFKIITFNIFFLLSPFLFLILAIKIPYWVPKDACLIIVLWIILNSVSSLNLCPRIRRHLKSIDIHGDDKWNYFSDIFLVGELLIVSVLFPLILLQYETFFTFLITFLSIYLIWIFTLHLLYFKRYLLPKLVPFASGEVFHFFELAKLRGKLEIFSASPNEKEILREIRNRESFLFKDIILPLWTERELGWKKLLEIILLPIVLLELLPFIEIANLMHMDVWPLALITIFFLAISLIYYALKILNITKIESQVRSTCMVLTFLTIIGVFFAVFYLTNLSINWIQVIYSARNNASVLRIRLILSGIIALTSTLLFIELPGYIALMFIKERKKEMKEAYLRKIDDEIESLLTEIEHLSYQNNQNNFRAIVIIEIKREKIRLLSERKRSIAEEIQRIEEKGNSPVPLLDKVLSGGLIGLLIALLSLIF